MCRNLVRTLPRASLPPGPSPLLGKPGAAVEEHGGLADRVLQRHGHALHRHLELRFTHSFQQCHLLNISAKPPLARRWASSLTVNV